MNISKEGETTLSSRYLFHHFRGMPVFMTTPMSLWRTQYWGLKILGITGLTLVVFALPHLMSESFIALYSASDTNTLQQQQLITTYRLDQPWWTQYGRWLAKFRTQVALLFQGL